MVEAGTSLPMSMIVGRFLRRVDAGSAFGERCELQASVLASLSELR